MKKLISLVFSGLAVFVLSGCGGSDNHHEPDPELTTLFLVDQGGYSYAGVPYMCDSMAYWSETAPNGEFSFYLGEHCQFDFLGLDGDYYGDIVYIVDYLDYGKGGIPYDCVSFGAGTTYGDGSFEYDIDDQCVFYF